MATSRKPTADEVDILADMDTEETEQPAEGDEELDLLDEIQEDIGVPWKPASDPDQPRGIAGKLVDRDEFAADYQDPETKEYPMIPLLVIETATETWQVRGYHKVLRSEIKKRDPQVGDTVGIKYFGQREAKKKGFKPTELYRMKVKRPEPA